MITFLKEIIGELEKDPVVFEFDYNGKSYRGEATPVPQACYEGVCNQFDIVLDDESIGVIQRLSKRWKMPQVKDQGLVKEIGYQISYRINKINPCLSYPTCKYLAAI